MKNMQIKNYGIYSSKKGECSILGLNETNECVFYKKLVSEEIDVHTVGCTLNIVAGERTKKLKPAETHTLLKAFVAKYYNAEYIGTDIYDQAILANRELERIKYELLAEYHNGANGRIALVIAHS